MKRRKALKILGGATILAAAGATVFATTRTPAKALKPWQDAGSAQFSDPRMRALSYAVLAPNPHNRQPWLIELKGDDELSLRFDVSRQLPHTDPFDRQLTIGLGCFLELMVMAANADGYRVDLSLFPEGSDSQDLGSQPVAHARFSSDPSMSADSLWQQVPHRRSNKEPFDTSRTVSPASLQKLTAAGSHGPALGGTVDNTQIELWRELTEAALRIEIETPHTHKESVDLFRIGKREVETNPDGIDFSGPLFETLHLTGMFNRDVALDTSSTAYKQGLDVVSENCRTSMGFVWMVTEGNSREEQIAAGADWLRVNLACTELGLGFHPMSQALQEYPEMNELYSRTRELLAADGGTVQMLARIGYGPDLPPSPRWPIESKIVQSG